MCIWALAMVAEYPTVQYWTFRKSIAAPAWRIIRTCPLCSPARHEARHKITPKERSEGGNKRHNSIKSRRTQHKHGTVPLSLALACAIIYPHSDSTLFIFRSAWGASRPATVSALAESINCISRSAWWFNCSKNGPSPRRVHQLHLVAQVLHQRLGPTWGPSVLHQDLPRTPTASAFISGLPGGSSPPDTAQSHVKSTNSVLGSPRTPTASTPQLTEAPRARPPSTAAYSSAQTTAAPQSNVGVGRCSA